MHPHNKSDDGLINKTEMKVGVGWVMICGYVGGCEQFAMCETASCV